MSTLLFTALVFLAYLTPIFFFWGKGSLEFIIDQFFFLIDFIFFGQFRLKS